MNDKEYVTKHELEATKQELLRKLVSKEDFQREIKRLDNTIEMLANQVGGNTAEIQKIREEMTGLRDGLRGEMTDFSNGLRGEMTDLSSGLRGEMTDLSSGLRGEMTGLRNGLRAEMADLRDEMNDRFIEMSEKFNIVLTAIDGLSGQIQDMRTEKAAGEHTFRRHETRLDDHETRIEQLERKAN